MKEVLNLVDENKEKEKEMNIMYDSMEQYNMEGDSDLEEEMKKMEAQMNQETELEIEKQHNQVRNKSQNSFLNTGRLSPIEERTNEKSNKSIHISGLNVDLNQLSNNPVQDNAFLGFNKTNNQTPIFGINHVKNTPENNSHATKRGTDMSISKQINRIVNIKGTPSSEDGRLINKFVLGDSKDKQEPFRKKTRNINKKKGEMEEEGKKKQPDLFAGFQMKFEPHAN